MKIFDNSVLPSIESTFKYSMKISKSSHRHTIRNDSESDNEDQGLDEIEALTAKRL